MRNALHRAVLRRSLLRLSVLAAFLLAFAALAPGAWLFSGELLPAVRGLLGLCAVALLVGAQALSLGRRSRARVTAPRIAAPRAAESGF